MKSPDKEFISESEEILEDAINLLLDMQDSLGGKENPDALNAMFRGMHTIKGMAGLYGYQGLSDISHALESLLDDVRLGRIGMSAEVIDFLFESIDALKAMLDELKRGGKGSLAPEQLERIEAFRGQVSRGTEAQPLEGIIDREILDVLSEYEEHRLGTNVKEGKGIYSVRLVFAIEDFDKKLMEFTRGIKDIGELVSTMPNSDDVLPGSIGFNLLFCSSSPAGEVRKALGVEIEELVKGKTGTSTGAPKMEDTAFEKAASSTVRVDISKLNTVLNTVGEISVLKNALRRLWVEATGTYGPGPLMLELYHLAQDFERNSRALQQQVLEMRMVPVGQIFGKLVQVIRRYAKSLGKRISIEAFGVETEIDKHLAEEVVDPLVHIVRNAVDHGIESAAERIAAGKTETGSITLKAFQKGNNVVIEIKDNGRGIDKEQVIGMAVQKGIIKDRRGLEGLGAYDLLFSPGFSTKEGVSEVSGRGVGLDIVRERLSFLGGTVDVESEPGEGTAFVLTLPITLAIVKALLVRAGGETFAMPLSSMSETMDVKQGDIRDIENGKACTLRDDTLPVAALDELLGLRDCAGKSFAVVAGHGQKRVCLLVDELIGQSEVVIKPLGGYLDAVRGIGGAAEIGKDDIVLVLDMESLIDEVLSGEGTARV